ncbi:sugar ABC transporter substrate-binding protein [Streptomyces sp. MP131-18]|uniref:ABC transporter substrate-binding protein n=1 Tax=Streptomyces sp. MP131-18 TaxID=1857892 RepID=UPI00097C2FAB|nr:sugar ABC transporter substrate-binding protein [Streptomyces sp. MP131-18]ONK13436.1 putative arabinose-binding protein precursor [Streptomyces sp. MP131-18]
MLQDDNDVAPSPTPSRRRFLTGAAGAAAGLAAAPALLTGCGSAGASGDTLQFWNFYAPSNSPDPAANRQSQWFVELIDTWNATHSVQIELVFVPQGTYRGGAKLPSAFAAGDGPDIFLLSPGDFLRYYNGGVLADLTPHMAAEAIADYGSALESRTVDGKVYALPMEIEPLAMFYDVAAWESAGLSEGDIPTTWDEMLDAGDKLRTGTRAGLVFDTPPGYYQNFTWYPWMWQGGGEVLAADGSVAFDSAATRQALRLWQQAVESGIAPRTLPAAGDAVSAFAAGNVAMWQQGIWQVASFGAYAPDFRYGIFKLPVPPGGEYTTALGGWSFCANAQGRNAEAAAEFCVWALGSTKEDSIERMVTWCTDVKTDIAPRASALELGAARGGYDFWAMKAFRDDIAPGGRAEPRYPPVVYKAVSDAIQGTMLAGRDPADEAERAARAIDAYTRSYEGASMI